MSDEKTETKKDGKDLYDASSIRVLGGIEHVRLRPAMYIGDKAERGLHHLFEEVVANSIDETMVGACDEIIMNIFNDGSISLMDNGRGIPVDVHEDSGKSALEVVMTTLNAGGKFDNNSYKVSAGLHGVGVSCVNALSEWMEVEVWRDDYLYFQRYEKGEPKTPVEKRGRSGRRGTKVTFKPDEEIFGDSTFNYEKIVGRLRELAFLNSGVRIILNHEEGGKEAFHYEDGIREFVGYLGEGKDPLHKVVSIQDERDGTYCDVAFQYNDGYNEVIFSFANNINTVDGGTHLSGFRAALTRTFNNWARDREVIKDITPGGDDYREGLIAVVSVKLPAPQFEGQTKTRLGNREIQGQVEQIVGEKLSTYCEENPGIAKKLVEKAVEAARARDAARKARDLTRRKGALSRGNLPAKLRDCSSRKRDETELFIVEGQSAGGTAGMGRDRTFQAILPLRGVILNVEKARVDKMLANEEIGTLISALGTGIGADEFKFDALRYGKIVIMTDADIDGAHIRTLLLTFFFRQMPSIIENGCLYIAQPPLYKVKRKGKEQYAYDDRALRKVLVELGSAGITLKYGVNGGEDIQHLNSDQFMDLINLLRNLEYFAGLIEESGLTFEKYINRRKGMNMPLYRVIETTGEGADREFYFYSEEEYDEFVNRRQKELEDSGEELEIIEEDDYVGLARTRNQPNVLKPHKFHEHEKLQETVQCIESYDIPVETFFGPRQTPGDSAGGRFVLCSDGEEETRVNALSGIIEAVQEMGRKGLEVERYKGLGEMNSEELAETTLDPETRSMLKVTVGDAVEADNYFSILAGKNVARRREFIETHALEVNNLDV